MTSEEELPLTPKVVEVLVNNHRQFLSFLQARLGNHSIAEEVLQTALAKGLEKAETIRDEERITAWFYRVLRNAVVDHYRRQSTVNKTLVAEDAESIDIPDEELEDTVCKCVGALVPTLKPEYASILEAVDIHENSLENFALEHGITANNATVRLHRARQALKRQLEVSCGTCVSHGCLNCTCEEHKCATRMPSVASSVR